MQLQIIYDNATISKDIQAGWGFSVLIDQRILFDTGEEPDSIFHNLNQLNVPVENIEAVVISHDHWDHVGGLWALLEKRKGLPVYACPGFSAEFKQKVRTLEGKLIESLNFTQITKKIGVTGEIPGEYKNVPMPEQALVLNTENGFVVITGCSHPGILTMLENVKNEFPEKKISLVLGGFHLKDTDTETIRTIVEKMKEMGIEKVGPTHCTGDEAQRIFKENFRDNYFSIQAGFILDI